MKKMKAYVLHLGEGYLDSNYQVRDDTCASVEEPNAPHRMILTPYTALLIDHPQAGWILYDTGPRKENWTPGMLARVRFDIHENNSMENQLKLVGIKPEDVKHVVMSHLHADHLGNLELFAKTANVYVGREEMAQAALTLLQSPDPEVAAQFWYLKKEVFQEVKGYTYIDHDYELFPGIDVITLPGHTACVLGLVVHLENQVLITVADAINEIRNYNGFTPGPLWDSKGWRESVQKVKELEAKYHAKVLFGHDVNQLNNEVKIAPEFYE